VTPAGAASRFVTNQTSEGHQQPATADHVDEQPIQVVDITMLKRSH
jgi:hypothetical protein